MNWWRWVPIPRMAPQNPTPACTSPERGPRPGEGSGGGGRPPGNQDTGSRLGPGTAGQGSSDQTLTRRALPAAGGVCLPLPWLPGPPPRRLRARRPQRRGNPTRGGALASTAETCRSDGAAPSPPRPQYRLRCRARGRMAQRLGERARVPAEATGLYRAVLLRSGKCEQGPLPACVSEEREEGGVGAPSSAPGQPAAALRSFPVLPSLSLCLITFLSPFLLSFLHPSLWGFVLLCVGACTHWVARSHAGS